MIENNDLPKGWTIAKFEDLLDYIQPTKYIVESTEYDDKYTTPVLTAGKSFIKGYTNELDGIFNSLPTIIFDDFTTATQFVNFPFKVKSSAMKILQPTCDLVNIKLAYYFMQIQNIKGDTHKRFWISEYSKLPVPLAPLNEQKRIIEKIEELITDLDKGIEYLVTAQQQLKVYRQAVLKWAFEGKFTHTKLKMVVTGDVIKIINNGYTPTNEFLFEGSGEIPFLKVYNLNFDGTLNFKKNPTFIPNAVHKKDLKRSICLPGDVLTNIVGPPLGKVSVVTNQYPEWNINQAIVMFRPNENVISKYISYFLQNFVTIHWLEGTSKATAGQWNIKVSTCRVIPFPYCPKEEQEKIVKELETRLSVCDKIEETLENSLLQAEALRLSIIKKAFEGKLVPQSPSDEPAEKLLERIRAANGKVKPEKEEKVKTSKKKTQLA
jgi:type I restriction enzyme S subunit